MSDDEHSTVLFQVPTPGVSRSGVRSYAGTLERDVAEGKTFCCLITSDRELQRLNREFRKHDSVTDVLSFPSADGNTLGEIAISFSRAKAQAGEYGHSVEQEIEILMLHGVLHLLGMDHETDRGQMARAENPGAAFLRRALAAALPAF